MNNSTFYLINILTLIFFLLFFLLFKEKLKRELVIFGHKNL